jgi:hypothetical protein
MTLTRIVRMYAADKRILHVRVWLSPLCRVVDVADLVRKSKLTPHDPRRYSC